MKSLFLIAVIGIGLFFVVGCINNAENVHSIMVANYPGEFEYTRFEKGREIERSLIKKGDKLYDDLSLWIMKKKNGWKKDFNSYVPQDLFFSKEMNINVINGLVIVNIKIKGKKWIQISREFANNERPIPQTTTLH
jgi:hypothetical protein